MSRDYKGTDGRRGGSGSSLLTGILIGLVLGLGVALAVAWYINRMPSPFTTRPAPAVRSEPLRTPPAPLAKADDTGAEARPRFDFYKILPGSEEPGTTERAKDPARTPAGARDAFYLQAGAFQNAPDADNLKARLALLGIEASIETTMVPDKGLWHRVRVGPYTSVEEVNRTRDTLKQNGVETTLVRVRESDR
jgi:cell division protein FtsN